MTAAITLGERLAAEQKKKKEAQAIAEHQEQFLSAVSHELRTPLNGIIGLSDSLIGQQSCTEQMTETLKLIKGCGQRLANLVNDILDTASVRRGMFSIKRELLSLQEVSENVAGMLQPLVPKGVSLVNRIGDAELPPIEGDSSRINQVAHQISALFPEGLIMCRCTYARSLIWLLSGCHRFCPIWSPTLSNSRRKGELSCKPARFPLMRLQLRLWIAGVEFHKTSGKRYGLPRPRCRLQSQVNDSLSFGRSGVRSSKPTCQQRAGTAPDFAIKMNAFDECF